MTFINSSMRTLEELLNKDLNLWQTAAKDHVSVKAPELDANGM